MDAVDASSEDMCRGQPVAQDAQMPEAAEEDQQPEEPGQAILQAPSNDTEQPAVAANSSEAVELAEAFEADAENAARSSAGHALHGTMEDKEPLEVPMNEEVAKDAADKEEAEEEWKEPVEMSWTKDPAETNTQDDVEANEKVSSPVADTEAFVVQADKEEAEEEGKEPVEMSLTKDPAEANTQDDGEANEKVSSPVADTEAFVVQAEEEGKEPVEMSLTKDQTEANTQDDVEANEKVSSPVADTEAFVVQAGKEEGEEEEAVEMSVTEDPAGMTLPEFAEDEEELLFTIDAAGESLSVNGSAEAGEDSLKAQKDPEPEKVSSEQATGAEETAPEAPATEKTEAACATCGLFGHEASACPFAHPEDIDLGDLEESDSDDELAELYPLFSRYVQQHIGALTPKDRKGLTGGGRYFGQEKQQACWACAEVGHDANECPDKGCFFCSKKGHESRDCPQKSLRCSYCNLRGHAPVSCPTLAACRLADFSHVRCMRCGTLGHPNCGVPPKAPDAPTQPVLSAREEAEKQQLLQQIAAGRARTRAWDTAPWRAKPDLELPNAKAAKVTKADVPVPDLLLED